MTEPWLVLADLAGIVVFAATGALVAVRKELDVFGASGLGLITGLGGGVVRDVLIGDVPPTALDDWRYLVVPVVTAVLVFFVYPTVLRMEKQIAVLDAVGIALFCVTGAVKAAEAGLDPLPAAVLGLTTAVGGGMMRDVLAGRVPVIFREELYATPAFAGAVIAVVTHGQGWGWPGYVAGAVVCLVWRLLALWRGWTAPLPPGVERG